MRNRFLTRRMHEFLVALRDSEDEYAIEEAGECWVDSEKFSSRTVNRLLHLCLLSKEGSASEGVELWVLNEDGRKIIDDPQFVPPIVKLKS